MKSVRQCENLLVAIEDCTPVNNHWQFLDRNIKILFSPQRANLKTGLLEIENRYLYRPR